MKKFILFFLLLSSPAFAVDVTLQNGTGGYSGAYDAGIYYADQWANLSGEEYYNILHPYSGNWDWYYMIKFDVSSIPATATISSATLSLYIDYNDVNGYGPHFKAVRIFKSWVEWEVSWTQWDNTNAKEWGTLGARTENDAGVDNSGDGTGDDTTETGEDTIEMATWTNYANTWMDFDIPLMVQGWVDGTMTNNGVMIKAYEENQEKNVYIRGCSNVTDGVSTRPKLVITYTDGGSPPVTWSGGAMVISE
jgi:hypothetical protein